jgi:NADH-quinone oxidoreductase subunit M
MLYRRVVFGPSVNADASEMPDLGRREFWLLAPIVFFVLWLGVFPGVVMDRISPSVNRLVTAYHERVATAVAEEAEGAGEKAEGTAAQPGAASVPENNKNEVSR